MARKSLVFFLGAIFTCCLASVSASGQGADTPAKQWQESSLLEKNVYFRGLIDGAVMTQAWVRVLMERPEVQRRYLRAHQSDRIPFDSLIRAATSTFVDITQGQWDPTIAIMDKLYADPANACIVWVDVAIAAQRTLHGRPNDAVQHYLERQRKDSKACEPGP